MIWFLGSREDPIGGIMKRLLIPTLLGFFHTNIVLADPLELEIIEKGQDGISYPTLILKANEQVSNFNAKVICASTEWTKTGNIPAKGRVEMVLDVPVGKWNCKGSLSAVFANGEEGEMPLAFSVSQLGELAIKIPRDQVSLKEKQLVVIMDRPASAVELTVFGENGEIGSGTAPVNVSAGEPITVGWSSSDEEVMRINVRAIDQNGFWAGMDLFPWFYNIPHEDVVFETGKAEVKPMEEGKLKDAKAKVNEVIDRYSSTEIEMKLYVGGFTDTVGDKSSNQVLSQSRAKSIAQWFKAQGFDREIYYQGFGENGLAIVTPDEVPQEENRRAAYVIAAEAPPSDAFPGSNWIKLK